VLEKTLKEATSQILINSPWITQQVIDARFKTHLENALHRQVHVTIIYGMGGDKMSKSDIDPNTEKYFDKLKKRYPEHMFIKETKGNHAKVVICDDKFMVVTSFNWLSFKGDKSRPLRTEYGTIIKNRKKLLK
jgi:phosphatidylserine/phosphatidylglycerophosphate/cardiolipin synthase-like enzyme